MKRRNFLKNVMLGAAAQVVAPGWMRAEVVVSDTAARFAESAKHQRWLAGWKTVGREELGPTEAIIEGKWPEGLQGTLYRNGPAWFDRAGLRYQHWFDGDGMVHAWRISKGRVQHRARMVATSKFVREQQAGRFLVAAAGTTIPDTIATRNNDDLNTANTAIIRFGGRVFALWEAGSAFEIDPESLQTQGPVTWREDLAAVPFSAHPLLDRDGTLWNFGSTSFVGGSGLLIWRIGPEGKLAKIATLATDAPGYLHAFAMTQQYLVFMFIPYVDTGNGSGFFQRLRFTPEQPCRIAVVPKDALDSPRWFEVDFCAAYHFGDAYERNGEIVMRTVHHPDIDEMRSPMSPTLRGEPNAREMPAQLVGLRLQLATKRARWETYDASNLEFPTFDARTPGTAPARLYAPISRKPNNAPYFNAIASIDAERGRTNVHHYGPNILAEEHRFVPKPGSHRIGEGWLIGTLLDYGKDRSGIVVLDAERVPDGPLAQAWLPHSMPLGFHGWFAPTST